MIKDKPVAGIFRHGQVLGYHDKMTQTHKHKHLPTGNKIHTEQNPTNKHRTHISGMFDGFINKAPHYIPKQ